MAGDDSKKVPTPKVSANVSVDPNPAYPSSKTGGVIPMGLETRFSHERARLSPDYTETWRKWRVQFLKDQELHPSEPRHVPQLVRETTNPIRRFYLIPFNWFEQNVLVKMMVSSIQTCNCKNT